MGIDSLNSYSYKLGLFPDPWPNNILGHILPNSTLWPAVAIFIAAYKPRFRWIITITLMFILLDILFISLGVYDHHWWQSWMTGIAIFTYCILMRFWYSKFEERKFIILRLISFSCILAIIMFMPTAILFLTNHEFYRVGIFTYIYRDSIIFSFILHITLAPLCILFLCILRRRYWKLIPFVIFFACDLLLTAFGILNFNNGWNVFFLIIIRTICLSVFIKLEEKYSYDLTKKIVCN